MQKPGTLEEDLLLGHLPWRCLRDLERVLRMHSDILEICRELSGNIRVRI